ncbi:MAG: Stf0 family sulfotransferase [Solirubrobacteraceae bacterium]
MNFVHPQRALVICATPRSGSTLLCELLKGTGVAGRPEEYFEARRETGLPPHPGDFLAGLPRTGVGIRDDATPPHAPEYSSLVGLKSYREHLARTLRLGTTANGVFATKLMWTHLPELCALAGELPELPADDPEQLLRALLGEPSWVWVTRDDKVRQAVSLWRALQTRAWRREHPSTEPDLHYRFDGIDHLVGRLVREDREWQAFFAQRRIDVLQVVYERDLVERREQTVHSVLAHLGVVAPGDWHAPVRMLQQADELSDDWVAAYHRDAGARVS